MNTGEPPHGSPRSDEFYRSQYEKLASVGITLNRHYTFQYLVRFLREEDLTTLRDMLSAMGDTMGRPPHLYFSDSVWWIDTECIDDPSAYASIAERMSDLAAPELPLKNMRSGFYWLEFEFKGKPYRWDFKAQDDWADEAVFTKFSDLLKAQGAKRRFAYSPGGQDFCLIYTDPEFLPRVRKVTGMDWRVMDREP